MNERGRVTQTFISALFVLSCAQISDSTAAATASDVFEQHHTEASQAAVQTLDVEHLRLQLEILPNENLIHGQLHIQVRATDGTPVIFKNSEHYDLVIDSDSAFVESDDEQSFLYAAEFDLRAGMVSFPLGIESGAWISVRSRELFKNRRWLPFSIDSNDQFSAEIRISVPEDWVVMTTGQPGPSLTGSDRLMNIAYFDSTSVVTDLAFAAFSTSQSDIRIVSAESDSSFFAGLKDVTAFLSRFAGQKQELSTEVDSSFSRRGEAENTNRKSRYLTSANQNQISALAANLVFIPEPNRRDPANHLLPELLYARIAAAEWVNLNIRFADFTDLWLYPALSAYLTGEYIREAQGSREYATYMWNQRDTYFLSEYGSRTVLDSRKQTRPNENGTNDPIVASRDAPDDTRLVEARGVWVLRMLADRVGRDIFLLALKTFVELSQTKPVGTDNFQSALDIASGESLGTFFDAWVYGPGHPGIDFTYTVEASQDAINVDVSQTGDETAFEDYYEVDAELLVSSLSGVDSVNVRLRGPLEHITVPVSLRPQFVLFDPSAKILYEPTSRLSTDLLVSGLRRSTGEAGRLAMLHQLKGRRIEPAHLLGLRSVLSTSLSDEIRALTVEIIGFAAPSRAAMLDLLAAAESESPILRAAALKGLSHFDGFPEARSLALQAANRSQNPLVLAAAVESLVQLDSTLSLPVLQAAMVTDSENDYVRREAVKTLMYSSIDLAQKWKMIRPLLSHATHPETRRAALSVSDLFVDQTEIRKELLRRWPRASALERRMLLDSFERLIPPDELSSEDIEELQSWLLAEPETDARKRLREYIPIREGIITIHPH